MGSWWIPILKDKNPWWEFLGQWKGFLSIMHYILQKRARHINVVWIVCVCGRTMLAFMNGHDACDRMCLCDSVSSLQCRQNEAQRNFCTDPITETLIWMKLRVCMHMKWSGFSCKRSLIMMSSQKLRSSHICTQQIHKCAKNTCNDSTHT